MTGATVAPPPVQQPHVPILIGGVVNESRWGRWRRYADIVKFRRP